MISETVQLPLVPEASLASLSSYNIQFDDEFDLDLKVVAFTDKVDQWPHRPTDNSCSCGGTCGCNVQGRAGE